MRWINGAFPILMAAALSMLLPSTANAQAVLSNGGNSDGAISVAGENDTWTFAANTGDSIVLRIGQLSDATGNFEPQIRLLSPANAQLGSSVGDLAAEIAVTAPSSGACTVAGRDGNLEHTADAACSTSNYRQHLAKSPGVFVGTDGDEGGDLINGADQDDSIQPVYLYLWSVPPSADYIPTVRSSDLTATGNFEPQIRLLGPANAQLGSSVGDLAAEIAVTAPSS